MNAPSILKWLAALMAALPAITSMAQIAPVQPPPAQPQPAQTRPAVAPPQGGRRGNFTPLPVDPATALRLQQLGKIPIMVHDPSTIIQCKDQYYVFYTGRGTPSWHSKDLITWQRGPAAFSVPPPWVLKNVPGNRSGIDFWAPECKLVGNRYLLFFSASTFGKNISAIGVASNSTLDPADPQYKWTDLGMVVQSTAKDDFNCIDPSVCEDADGKLWLSFGSFWSGIKMIQLDPATGMRISPDSPMYSLAYNGSIEASYVCHHGDYYYLFVSWGLCCHGVNSTYNTRVGRSEKITGPYLDKTGRDMLDNGGSPFLLTDGPMIGPGQVAIFHYGDSDRVTMHYYDASQRGQSFLAMRSLTWTADGWPEAGENTISPK